MPFQNGSNGGGNSHFGPRLVSDFIKGASLTRTEKIEDVWITSELYGRVPREANIDKDLSALRNIAAMVQTTPAEILTTLMQQALIMCPADTAGLSVLHAEDGGQFFHWDAMAGVLHDKVGGTTPRKFSPCGHTMDCNDTQLVLKPGRYYSYFLDVDPQIMEALIVPVVVDRACIGTIWIAAHDPRTHFTLTDVRIMGSLASFTGAAISLMNQKKKRTQVAHS
ncbi:MAG TPA: GAF domain-containing protein [Candidatus Angelobacter sp.]|nr:GAF domain-containing protein [Candidatus Angelobacter sp.]